MQSLLWVASMIGCTGLEYPLLRCGSDDTCPTKEYTCGAEDLVCHPQGEILPKVTLESSTPMRLPGQAVLDLRVADLDGDGRDEVILVTTQPDIVTILSGPQLATSAQYPLGGFTNKLATADLDGDGKLDLIVSTSRSLDVLVQANGTFGPPIAIHPFQSLEFGVGDVDGDGRPDVVVTEVGNAGQSVVLLSHSATGLSFASPVTLPLPVQMSCLELADVDRDGRADILICASPLGIARANPHAPGGFDPLYSIRGAGGPGIEVVDIDGDGRADILSYNAGSVVVVRNDERGLFDRVDEVLRPMVTGGIYAEPPKVAVGDLNGDGRMDVATGILGALELFVQVRSTQDNILFEKAFADPTSGVFALVKGKFDGDGKIALFAVSNESSGGIVGRIWRRR